MNQTVCDANKQTTDFAFTISTTDLSVCFLYEFLQCIYYFPGTGGAFGYTTAMVVVGFNFKKKRNLALGIAVSGVGAGVFILAPLMQLSRDYYGPVGFFIILAAIAANIITLGCMCFPSKLEKYTQLHRRYETRKLSASRFSCASLKVYLRVLCNKGVICLCVCMFCFCLGTILIYVHLPTFIVSKGFSAFQAAFLVSLSGILSLIGRILTGIVANLNRINETYLYSGSFGIVSVACFIYPFSSDYFVAHVIFVVLFGLFFGCCYVIMTAVTLPFVGIHYISAAIGLQLFFGGIGSIVGPVLAGIIIFTFYYTPECRHIVIALFICPALYLNNY